MMAHDMVEAVVAGPEGLLSSTTWLLFRGAGQLLLEMVVLVDRIPLDITPALQAPSTQALQPTQPMVVELEEVSHHTLTTIIKEVKMVLQVVGHQVLLETQLHHFPEVLDDLDKVGMVQEPLSQDKTPEAEVVAMQQQPLTKTGVQDTAYKFLSLVLIAMFVAAVAEQLGQEEAGQGGKLREMVLAPTAVVDMPLLTQVLVVEVEEREAEVVMEVLDFLWVF